MSVIINGSAGVTTNSGAVYDSLQRGTAVTASGTSVDFTSIPSWVRRVTVMFSGVSTNGTNPLLVQIGSGSIQTTGYISTGITLNNAAASAGTNSTAGFVVFSNLATSTISANVIISNIQTNVWVSSHSGKQLTTNAIFGGGDVTLSGTLDRLRIIGSTTGSPTDTFDAGTINIIYE